MDIVAPSPPVAPDAPSRVSVSERTAAAIDLSAWQAVCDSSPSATFFHTPRWFAAFASADPSATVTLRTFRFHSGTTAVIPILHRRKLRGLWRSEESSPAACYGGWIADRPLIEDEASTLARFLRSRASNLVWRINPFDPHQHIIAGSGSVPDTTELLDLTTFGDAASLRSHYRHSVRKQINKACRSGLQAWVAEDWKEWEAYYHIYEERLRRWGRAATNRHPARLFRAFWQDRGSAIRLWVVARDGRIVGGNLNFYHGRHCVEWHAAYDCDLFSCGVRDFLVDTIIQDARGRGFAWYDFNPSGGHEGTRRFKQTFGTVSMRADLVVCRRGLYASSGLRTAARSLRTAFFGRGAAVHPPAQPATAACAETDGGCPAPAARSPQETIHG